MLVLGAGDMGEAMALGLAKAGQPSCSSPTAPGTPPSRSPSAPAAGPCASATLADALGDVDVLLTSTGAATPLLEADDLEPVHRAPRAADRC